MIRVLATATGRKSLHCGSIANPITVMEQEHVAVGVMLKRLRQITGGYLVPDGTCASTRTLMAGLAALVSRPGNSNHNEGVA